MKPRWLIVAGSCLAAAIVVYVHEFMPPTAEAVRWIGDRDGNPRPLLFKDGGSFGLTVVLADGTEEWLIVDRSFVFSSPASTGAENREDGLVYLGGDAKSAHRPLDSKSSVFRDLERMVRYEQNRWLIRYDRRLGRHYAEGLADLMAGFERTKKAKVSSRA